MIALQRILVVLLLTSCSGPAPVEQEAATEPPPSRPPVREDRRADIEACTRAMREAEQMPAAERITPIVETCKNLWLDPQCREAWSAALDEPPESRGESVIRRCAEAMCPQLQPAPAICAEDLGSVDLLAQDPDWGDLWKELSRVSLARDLGLAPTDRLGAILGMRLLQLVAISGNAPPQEEVR